MKTDAERHRLIISHSHLCPMVASDFRGSKGIPFEELTSAGMIGLCEAARDWSGEGVFGKFARIAIKNQIIDFTRAWGAPSIPLQIPDLDFPHQVIQPDVDHNAPTGRVYEWQSWGTRGNVAAIAEHWEGLAATPEEIIEQFDQIKQATSAVMSAMIGFSVRERKIFTARFFAEPRQSLESIARSHKISYARTVFLIDRMLKKIRKILQSREAAIPSATLG